MEEYKNGNWYWVAKGRTKPRICPLGDHQFDLLSSSHHLNPAAIIQDPRITSLHGTLSLVLTHLFALVDAMETVAEKETLTLAYMVFESLDEKMG